MMLDYLPLGNLMCLNKDVFKFYDHVNACLYQTVKEPYN